MTVFPRLSAIGALLALTACGGSSGSGVMSTSGAISIHDVNAAGRAYFDFAADGYTALDQSALSDLGSASYDGYMLAVPTSTLDALVGRTQIDASFADGGSLTGQVTDLILVRENADVVAVLTADVADGYTPIDGDVGFINVSGALALSDGAVRRIGGEAIIDVDVTGTVNIPGAAFDAQLSGTENFDVTGGLHGQVADSGEFFAEGTLYARGQRLNFNLDTGIFAE